MGFYTSFVQVIRIQVRQTNVGLLTKELYERDTKDVRIPVMRFDLGPMALLPSKMLRLLV